jgi:hypothetical protein
VDSTQEKLIQELLKKIAQSVSPDASCLALVREAETELTPQEIKALTPTQSEAWNRLTAANRRLEWSEARRCEAILKSRLGGKSGGVDLRTSISHTRAEGRPIVFAAGVAGKIAGVGIDAEFSSRDITEAAAAKFVQPDERKFGLSLLQIWVIKEALFKANPQNDETTLIDYRIETCDQHGLHGTALIDAKREAPAREFKFAWIDLQEWLVAVAVS